MVKGVTRSGFEFEAAEDIANDMELFEALSDLDGGDYSALVPVCRIVLGTQKKALYEHLRKQYGKVPIDKVYEEITDIFGALKDGKKS